MCIRDRAKIEAIKLLKYLEETTGQATPEQQETLSRYVGWGGIPQAFDAVSYTHLDVYKRQLPAHTRRGDPQSAL